MITTYPVTASYDRSCRHVGTFLHLADAQRMRAFVNANGDSGSVDEDHIYESITDFIIHQDCAKNPTKYDSLLNDEERKTFARERALAKLTPEEKILLGL